MPVFDTPEAVQTAFYFALERASLDTMMALWEDSGEIVCIHPMGPRLRGREQVTEGWRRLFTAATPLLFKVGEVHTADDGALAVRLVVEHIRVLGSDEQPPQPVLATNVYRRGADGWRMLAHHASPGATTPSPRPLSSSPPASSALH